MLGKAANDCGGLSRLLRSSLIIKYQDYTQNLWDVVASLLFAGTRLIIIVVVTAVNGVFIFCALALTLLFWPTTPAGQVAA